MIRENRRGNQKWTIKKHRQHWAQDTEQRQTQHGKTKYEQHGPHQKPGVRNYTHI